MFLTSNIKLWLVISYSHLLYYTVVTLVHLQEHRYLHRMLNELGIALHSQ